jgi:hypothetical protein
MLTAPRERRLYNRCRAGGLRGFIRYLAREDMVPVRLIDFGCGGAGVMFEPASDIPAGTSVSLLVSGMELSGVSVGTCPCVDGAGSRRMGIRFHSPISEQDGGLRLLSNCGSGSESARPRTSMSEETSSIVDDAAIMKILDYFLLHRKERLSIRTAGGRLVGRGRAELTGRRLSIRIDEPVEALDEGVLVFSFQGFIAYYEFKERIVALGQGRLMINVPLVLLKKRKRRFPRLGTVDLPVWVSDPVDKDRILKGRVLDLDFGGLALELEGPAPLIQVGAMLRKVVVRLPGCGEVQLEGMVRHADTAGWGMGLRLGIEAASFFRGCRQVWNRYVFNLLLPDLAAQGFDFEADEFIDVLDRSGYLELCGKTRDFYRPITPSFGKLYRSTETSPHDRNFIFHFGDELMGVAGKNRIYSSTCLLHHLGVDAGSGFRIFRKENIAKQILLGVFIHAYLTDNLRYSAIYFSANKKWNTHLYDDFLATVERKDCFVSRPFRFLEYDLTAVEVGAGLLAHSDVMVAGAGDREEISGFLRECVPHLMFEAYDYEPGKLDLSTYNSLAVPGLSRQRTIFFCRRQGRVAGVALAETSTRTINLFNLGDSVRVFTRRDLELEEEEQERIKSRLLAKALCFFAAQCRPYFVFFCYDEEFGYARDLGFRKIDDSREIILDREILPSYIDYIETTLSMTERMKRMGKTSRGDSRYHSRVGQV